MNIADPELPFRWTVALAAVASIVTVAELIAVAAWNRTGVFWRCCQSVATDVGGSIIGRVNGHLARWMPAIFVLKAVAAASTLLLIAMGATYREALWVLTACALAVSYWRLVGGDGAIQMTLIALIACSLALLIGDRTTGPAAALSFVGGQGLLAYMTAGVAKIVSQEWRTEDVVSKIASTVAYGSGPAARVIAGIPGFGRTLTVSVIVFETAMPFSVLFPVDVTAAFLLIALVFHIGCAVVMGLNDFVWAFAATFPGILYISSSIHR